MIITLAEKTDSSDNSGMYPYGTTLELPDLIRATITGSIGDVETNEIYGYGIEWELLSNGYRFWSDEHCDRIMKSRFEHTARIISEAALLGSNPKRLESHLRNYGVRLFAHQEIWKYAKFESHNQRLVSTRRNPYGQFSMQWKLRQDMNDPRGSQISIGFIEINKFGQE